MKITKVMVAPLLEAKKIKQKEVQKLDIAIRSLQELCDHDWVGDGHDSHKNHYRCSICGDTESR